MTLIFSRSVVSPLVDTTVPGECICHLDAQVTHRPHLAAQLRRWSRKCANPRSRATLVDTPGTVTIYTMQVPDSESTLNSLRDSSASLLNLRLPTQRAPGNASDEVFRMEWEVHLHEIHFLMRLYHRTQSFGVEDIRLFCKPCALSFFLATPRFGSLTSYPLPESCLALLPT